LKLTYETLDGSTKLCEGSLWEKEEKKKNYINIFADVEIL